jgi:hypothetical protein
MDLKSPRAEAVVLCVVEADTPKQAKCYRHFKIGTLNMILVRPRPVLILVIDPATYVVSTHV